MLQNRERYMDAVEAAISRGCCVTCSEFCAVQRQERRSTVVLGLMEMPPASRWMQHTERRFETSNLSLSTYIYTYIYTYVYIYINCICIIYLHLQVHACPGNQNALLSDVLFNFPGVKTDGIYISFLVNSPSWLPLFREDINALLSSPFDLMQRILGGNAEILG